MLISHKHKLVIFTLERTASQSIHSSLEHLFDVSIDGMGYRHLNVKDFNSIIVPFIGDNYYKIAVVREPIQRCISFYNKITIRKFRDYSFEDWWIEVRITKFISQLQSLSIDNKIYVDRLFDFNRLDLFCNFLKPLLNEEVKLQCFNKIRKETVPLSATIDDMQSVLKKDITFYKSIVDAGGELIINPYRSIP